MAAAAVNHAHAAQAGTDGSQNELVESETRLPLIHAMQVQPGLNGKASGSKIVEIQPSTGVHGRFYILGSLLDLDVAVLQEFHEHSQGFRFVVLRLDLE